MNNIDDDDLEESFLSLFMEEANANYQKSAPIVSIIKDCAAIEKPIDYSIVSLIAMDQTIETMSDPLYWIACCPWLSCNRNTSFEKEHTSYARNHLENDNCFNKCELGLVDYSAHRASLCDQGFTKIDAHLLSSIVTPSLLKLLERGIRKLVSLGHSASAINAYDESWRIHECLGPMMEELTGNSLIGDWFSFHISSQSPGGFVGPHRDKPSAGATSFCNDGRPMYDTIWLAITDATPERSCLYFIPRCHDSYYYEEGDNLDVLPTFLSWQHIIAQPVSAGSILCFSHRVIHWGSQATPNLEPRIAMSFAVADANFETPFFNHTSLLPYPPLSLRVALRAGQAILYNYQSPLSKGQLALDYRMFSSQKLLFSENYYDKISSEAQFLKYRLKNNINI